MLVTIPKIEVRELPLDADVERTGVHTLINLISATRAAVHVLLLEAALAAALPPPLPHEVLHPGARSGPIRGEY